ncbi:chromate transporter [Pusillimonas sp. ANT_WB101]|uniref:chromate transporter n=1 Tax=Pusillimonas sp. ANT_WB101 TaxID=2597356 RepID=UPI0011ED711B|nr:chromate transporter [Pusillimonas sp. ANT_WB101]KAA0892679.1 chromate transporter [Pusillimonas sp. ANT_WB101]NYT78413.1 chromate transporter [Alcaligenaceae bacterium]
MSWQLTLSDWWYLVWHFLSLSLLTVGSGVLIVAPQIHTFLVNNKHWLTEMQFNSSITLAQTAPGPNMLYIALLGWNVGINASGWIGAFVAMMTSLLSMLLPSSIVTLAATRWAHKNRRKRIIRAFKAGMSPISTALLIATGWLLMRPYSDMQSDWPLWCTTAITALLVWHTRIHLLLLLAAGAVLGALNIL